MDNLIRFGQFSRLSHPADRTPDDTMTVAKNVDLYQEGAASPRDGLARPDNWPGVLHTSTGALRSAQSRASFTASIRSLIPVGVDQVEAPEILFGES